MAAKKKREPLVLPEKPGHLHVRNWQAFQHYTDRSPPWIKLHRELLMDYDFSCLQDASKLHLMLIWLLASQLDNNLVPDAEWIRRQIGVNEPIDLSALIAKGFLYGDSKALACCQQVAMLEAEAEAEAETESETEKHSCPTEKKPKRKKSKPPQTVRFEEWYAEYPRKESKQDGIKAWKQGDLDACADLIIEKTKKMSIDRSGWTDKKYIPLPGTFLRGQNWLDEYVTHEEQQHADYERTPAGRRALAEQRTDEKFVADLNDPDAIPF